MIQQDLLLLDHQVWLGLGISIVCIIAVLNLIQRYLQYRSVIETTLTPNNHQAPTEKVITKGETGKQYLYVFGNLLSQGLTIPNESNDSFILTAVRIFIATISHNCFIIN
jgi:hypothetical protein